MTIKSLYKNYYSTQQNNSGVKVLPNNYRAWKLQYLKYLPKKLDSTMLDLGCGSGDFLQCLKMAGYNNVHGVDLSAEQVKVANSRSLNVVKDDILHYLHKTKTNYDVIIARDVLEHLEKKDLLPLAELVNRRLKSGGRFLIQSVNGQSPLSGAYRYGDLTHTMAFTWKSLTQLLLNSGFKNIYFYELGPVPISFVAFIRLVMWKIIVSFWKLISLVETGSAYGVFTQNILFIGRK